MNKSPFITRAVVSVILLSVILGFQEIWAQNDTALIGDEDKTLTSPVEILTQENRILSLEEFLAMIKAYHPYVKQAKIELSAVEAKLLASRGIFDPKVSVKGASKTFDGENYYEKLGTTFKIPTYFGIDLLGSFDRNQGSYLNPADYLEQGELYSVGADVDLGRGFWANERLNTLKQAKFYNKQAAEKARIEVNKILFEATQSYLKWYESYTAYAIWQQFVNNAEFRLQAVRSAYERGDVAAIDTTEATIAFNTRALSFQQAQLELRQSTLKVSNYLWLDEVPLELSRDMRPEDDVRFLGDQFTVLNRDLTQHPLLRAANFGVAAGLLDQRLKTAGLLPEMSLGYRWLSGSRNFEQLGWSLDPQNNTTQFKGRTPFIFEKRARGLKTLKIKTAGGTTEFIPKYAGTQQ